MKNPFNQLAVDAGNGANLCGGCIFNKFKFTTEWIT